MENENPHGIMRFSHKAWDFWKFHIRIIIAEIIGLFCLVP